IESLFELYENAFNGLKTEDKHFNFFEGCGELIRPIDNWTKNYICAYNVGICTSIRKDYTPKKNLKALLEEPEFFTTV
ncbi:hypothetical protein ILUMI_04446, partial [Ignelater luminosus]